jgi:NAD(P)-dependent dehydrogenase (short-subunit alcohol dehydrogenase family)
MTRFHNKVALVTGAASGIGAAVAKTLAAQGASVVVADFNDDDGERVVQEIISAGGSAAFRHVDVSDPDQVRSMVNFAVATFGALHLAHNNAGVFQPELPFHEIDLKTWNHVLGINVLGVVHCLQSEIAHFLAFGGGVIVNTASAAGLRGSPHLGAYVASKHAVVGITRTVAREYAGRIRVNAIAPGLVETPMISLMNEEHRAKITAVVPLGRVAQPQEIADLTAFLLSDESSYITGAVYPIDGGLGA